MKGRAHFRLHGISLLLAATATACSDPNAPSTTPVIIDIPTEEICPAHANWLPQPPEYSTDPQTYFKPAAHPATECPFYSLAWQNFLYATQPIDADATPRIKTYPTIDDVFTPIEPLPVGALAPEGQPRGTDKRSWLGLIQQAGFRDVAIDQAGRTLYYGIHVNQAFAKFIQDHQLTTGYAVQNAPNDLILPSGMVEFKSAWEQIDNDADADGFVSTKAWVPHISVDKSADPSDPTKWTLVENHNQPTQVTVRLLALHVVVTFPGHPEFFWGHLEHTAVDMRDPTLTDFKAENGYRDLAPITIRRDEAGNLLNPDDNDNADIMDPVSNDTKYILYGAGTPVNQSNRAIPTAQLAQVFREDQQKFLGDKGNPVRTSIYRLFPASKSNTTDPDDAISSLNHNVEALFRTRAALLQPNDFRGHYRLVGGQWMDKPAFFKLNFPIQNDSTSPLLDGTVHEELDATQASDRQAVLGSLVGKAGSDAATQDIIDHGSDSAFSILAGEDRMSGMPLESFTQTRGAFSNCFTCHNTMTVASNGVPYKDSTNGRILMPPKLINVSHVFSEFVRDECDKPQYHMKVTDMLDGPAKRDLSLDPKISSDALVAACPQPAVSPPTADRGTGQ